MASYTIRKGLNIRLTGEPAAVLTDAPRPSTFTIYPTEYDGLKPRLSVAEGSPVKRGTPLFCDKRNEAFKVCSPVSGTVKSLLYGPRRALQGVVIEPDANDTAENFPRYPAVQIKSLDRDTILKALLSSGLLALIRQRPFSRMADAAATPKSIFVNAMDSAPHRQDLHLVLKGRELAFQAGLDALTTLTKGKVHLCLAGEHDHPDVLQKAKNVEIHEFTGPHPAGNTSVHISRIDPIRPHDIVWTIRAAAVALIGELLIHGEWPATRFVALAGDGVKESARKHYRIRVGAPLSTLLKDALAPGEQRIISGNVLSGSKTTSESSLRFNETLITVIPEDRSRHFLGWMVPGFNLFSASRTFFSTLLGGSRTWSLGTNQHGELRPMVLTGLYDKYLPMNIMVDYLIRAILANDTDEAVKLGILEVDPEDFALCAFACPSKMDLIGIVRQGLQDIEKEGI